MKIQTISLNKMVGPVCYHPCDTDFAELLAWDGQGDLHLSFSNVVEIRPIFAKALLKLLKELRAKYPQTSIRLTGLTKNLQKMLRRE